MKKYADLCGITESELRNYFDEEITRLADEQELSKEECLEQLKKA